MTISEQIEKLEGLLPKEFISQHNTASKDATCDATQYANMVEYIFKAREIIRQLTAPPTEGEIAEVIKAISGYEPDPQYSGADLSDLLEPDTIKDVAKAAISAFMKWRGVE